MQTPSAGRRDARWLVLLLGLCLWLRPGDVAAAEADATGATGKRGTDHWSFQPLHPVAVPAWEGTSHPIATDLDHFVQAKLVAQGLQLGTEAERAVLLRRLSFDLTGLPPTPEELDLFLRDPNLQAYERAVERLLASPRYGERWARHWLDVVRYTESQGFEYDKLRDNAWHYRDYVIRSLNQDKPFNQFMREQVAGDVIEPLTQDGMIGPSLLICGPYDEAGNAQANATQRLITREDELEDTVSVVGQTFLGLTINCARCHSHKFDPISLDEYYRFKAVFEGVKHGERGILGQDERATRERRIESLKQEVRTAQDEVRALEERARQRFPQSGFTETKPPAQVPTATYSWNFSTSNNPAPRGHLKGGAKWADGALVLPNEGAYFQSDPLPSDLQEKTLEVWVALADLAQGGGSALTLENSSGSAFDGIVFGERQAKKWMAGSEGFVRTRDLNAPEETATPAEFVQIAIVYAADSRVTLYRNGKPYGADYTTGNTAPTFRAGDARVLLGMRHTGGGKPWLTGRIRSAAIYNRALKPEEIAASHAAGGFSISPEQLAALLTPEEREARDRALKRATTAQASLDSVGAMPVSYVGTRVQPKPTQRLRRGDVKSPEAVVAPGALSALKSLQSDFGLGPEAPEAQRRLKFADWLANPANPLPARVMVNRVWHFHFGQGLVTTPNDFGASGARPSHPELLDWLASRFIADGWSLKALHRLIVTSATYRQSSDANEKALAIDADDQLLWRYPPRRLEAEAVRDAMLAIGGEMNWSMGGPSFRPFEFRKFPANAYVPLDLAGPEYNRRSIYRMNVNSGKEPLMDAFDCPDPAVKTPRRGVTTTPLQALSLMNNSFVQRQAANLAAQANQGRQPRDLARSVQRAYRLALGRFPTADELNRAQDAARSNGLESVCWALLNSTEFVYVR